MSDKVRVKDLAADLNMQPKEMLTVIKELSIQAKAATSVLADEEIARIKERFAQGHTAGKRDGADVIVRRRRKSEPEPVITPEDATAPAQSIESPVEKIAQKEAEGHKTEELQKTEALNAERPKTGRAQTPPKTAKVVQEAGARVVSRPVKEPRAEAAQKVDIKPEAAELSDKNAPAEKGVQGAKIVKTASQANLSAAPEIDAHGTPVSSAPQFAESTPEKGRENAAPGADDFGDGAKTSVPPKSGGVRVISRPSADHASPRGANSRPDKTPADRSAKAGAPRLNQPPRPGQGPRHTGDSRPQNRFGAPDAPLPLTEEGDRGKKRTKGKRTVEFGEDKRFKGGEGDEGWARSTRRGKSKKGRPELKISTAQPLKAAKRKIRMEEFIRVSDLAHQMALKAGEIIKVLFNLGVMATINQSLDLDTATLVAAEFSYEVERVGFSEEEFVTEQEDDSPDKMTPRPPVVTIMGHVDHGKTSLLDAIRKTSVTSGEAGGITQHIGAYHVRTKKGDIVFLDTPGHEAFTAMRARGAEVTDIVVLVVAADDGVMEQTREAINHSKAAGVPIMVAVNKMDKAEANPDRVKRELADLGMVAEEWGGNVTFSYVSAKTREGLDDFLELLALQAEILELKANPDKAARGHIVEAKLDKGRGALGTVLIQHGTLRVGDSFVCGVHHGRVRALFDDNGNKANEAGPSIPVEVQGFEGVPEAGEEFIVIADEKTARRIAETRSMKQRERELAKESKVTLETFLSRRADQEEALVLNLVLKADVQGSVEAVQDQLKKLSGEKVRINVVHSGAGAISESDVLLAAASDAIIIGFNVRPNPKTRELAEQEKIDIRFYDIIYKLVEEIHSAMEGMLSPVAKEVSLGSAEVREVFGVPKVGNIAGCFVNDGKIIRNARVRLLRDGIVVHTGQIASLRRFKDDAREVIKGYECGIGIENYNDIKAGDVIEAFEIIEEAARL